MNLSTSRLVLVLSLLTVQSALVTSRPVDQSPETKQPVDEHAVDLDFEMLEQRRPPVLTIDRQNHQKLRDNLLEIVRRRQQAAKNATPDSQDETTTSKTPSTSNSMKALRRCQVGDNQDKWAVSRQMPTAMQQQQPLQQQLGRQ